MACRPHSGSFMEGAGRGVLPSWSKERIAWDVLVSPPLSSRVLSERQFLGGSSFHRPTPAGGSALDLLLLITHDDSAVHNPWSLQAGNSQRCLQRWKCHVRLAWIGNKTRLFALIVTPTQSSVPSLTQFVLLYA